VIRIVDTLWIAAPPERVFRHAAEVERWPEILPHYRSVRLRRSGAEGTGIVEMAADRPFGPFNWPTWWASEMWVTPARREVRYRHIEGITRGMDVLWSVEPEADGTRASIVHQWSGPAWPLIGRPVARWIIMPVFVHGIASRTLAGVRRAAEADHV
jgi:ribosome-associated toxin RatA of RatAB toxin-antitoxin module